ncbi:MAG: glycosyltransferase family 4 protein [Akkermansia sp.]|nr:glycosyltransferase family 4 protein [Akkermansia sp.]
MKPKIAILSNIAVWNIRPEIPRNQVHDMPWLYAFHKALQMQDIYEIHWITQNKYIPRAIHFEEQGQHFHVLPKARLMIGLYTMYAHDRYVTARELRKIQPDLVHTWGTEDCYGLCGKDFKGKWLHSVQGLLNACVEYAPMGKFFSIHRYYEPQVLRKANFITTESQWAAERVCDTAPRPDIKIWDYAVEEQFFRIQRNLAPSPTCLYCGSDSQIKNIQTAVAAFSSPELSHVKLLLAGVSPEQHPEYPANVIALGKKSREEVASLLSQAWCLVHPSLADTGPTAAKEALTVGVPLVISSHCGCKQYVQEGKTGYVVEPRDVQGIIQAVLNITQSRDKCLEMSDYARNLGQNTFSLEAMRNGIMDIYREILSSV